MKPAGRGASVLLLHGMAQTPLSMLPLAQALRHQGYRVRNLAYPTRPHDVAQLANRYLAPAVAAEGVARPVHLVTHSLGGLIARHYLQSGRLPPGSRIVMLAPPNHGSEVADFFHDWTAYRWLMGAVGQQLVTGEDGIASRLGPLADGLHVGIIAGNRTIQPWFSALLPGEDDGAVSVASTRLEGMRDFIVVGGSHTVLVFKREVRTQVIHFLRHGRFRR